MSFKSAGFPFLLLFILPLITAGCKTFDSRQYTAKYPVNTVVKPMKIIVNMESMRTCFGNEMNLNDTQINHLSGMIKNNLVFNTENSKTYLSIIVRDISGSSNLMWIGCSASTLFLVNLVGVPIGSQRWVIEIEAAVMDSSGRVLKIIKTRGEDIEYAAMFWGYSMVASGNVMMDSSVRETAYTRALLAALAELRAELSRNAADINKLVR